MEAWSPVRLAIWSGEVLHTLTYSVVVAERVNHTSVTVGGGWSEAVIRQICVDIRAVWVAGAVEEVAGMTDVAYVLRVAPSFFTLTASLGVEFGIWNAHLTLIVAWSVAFHTHDVASSDVRAAVISLP
jgi:hypothetical protein